jgi:hypothetical protein
MWATVAIATVVMIFAPTAQADEPLKYGVVISAMYAGGGNTGATYTHDYIEIFNASDAPVDITDWSVQYSNPVSAHWQKTFLPPIVLLPGQYLLARQDDGPNGTVAPPADAQGSVGMQGDGSYKVTIVRSRLTIHDHSPFEDDAMDGKIEDFFGGGAANRWEGQAANNGFPTNWTQAWYRHDGGCQDTDNNNNDFYVGPAYPNARSLASPLNPCSGVGTTGTITSTETVTSGQQVTVTVNDADLPGSSVAINATASNGDTETLTLNGSSGSFSGMFTVGNAPANSGNGSIELQSGTITFTYVDALDSGGLTNQNRTDLTTVNAAVLTGTTGTINSTGAIFSGQQVTVTVNDIDLAGTSVGITAVASNGDTESLTLNGGSGVFSGMFTVGNAPANSGNGSLELQSGTITFTYVDALDGGGLTNQNRTDVTTVNPIGTTGAIDAPASIEPGADYVITVTDADLTDPTINVTVTSDAGELQVVSVGMVSAGVYSTTFNTTDVVPTASNGTIEGRDGDVLTATYVDELDANGSQNQNRTATTDISATVVPDDDIELVVNGSLEDGKDGWTFSAGAKRKCNGFGDGSDCAFKLLPKSNAKQRGVMGPIFALHETAAGDVLEVSASIRTAKANRQRIVTVIIVYDDPTAGAANNGRDKFKLFVEQPTTGYQTFTENFILDGSARGGRVTVSNILAAGNLRVDDVSVWLIGSTRRADTAETRSADGLLPLPAAPDNFRGSN